MEIENISLQLRKGLLILAVLQVIGREKQYSANILEALEKTDFATSEGTLYPLLSRLKRLGLLDYEWVESVNGPPRKYYVLSEKGDLLRKSLLKELQSVKATMNQLGGEK